MNFPSKHVFKVVSAPPMALHRWNDRIADSRVPLSPGRNLILNISLSLRVTWPPNMLCSDNKNGSFFVSRLWMPPFATPSLKKLSPAVWRQTAFFTEPRLAAITQSQEREIPLVSSASPQHLSLCSLWLASVRCASLRDAITEKGRDLIWNRNGYMMFVVPHVWKISPSPPPVIS